MTELNWQGPFRFRELVLDYDLRPPFEPGVYTITADPPPPTFPADVHDPPIILYAGMSTHLGERFGDLAFGLLRLTEPGGWSFHGADVRFLEHCEEHGIDPLDLQFRWAFADCPRCAEVELHARLWPTVLNQKQARNCSDHPEVRDENE